MPEKELNIRKASENRSLDQLIATKGPQRFMFITDWHARGKAPSKRSDDYRAALLAKLNWVMDAGDKIGAVDTIVGGGDIFDNPTVALEVADDLVDTFVHRSRSGKRNYKVATIFGNHDLERSLSTATRTILGHLVRRGNGSISILPLLHEKPYTLAGFDIWGHHYKYQNHKDSLYVPITGINPRVIISHSMILKEEAIWEDYSLFSSIETNADLILLGHYHPQQAMERLKNVRQTLIGGPGALMRGSLHHDNLTRQPSMAVVEKTANGIIVDFIPIECAKPASEVFRIEQVKAEQAQVASLESFRKDLDNMKVQALNIAEMVEDIASQDQVSDDVKQEALKRIGVV